jgi:poly(3-hydroxybutyrate) depolymerase
MLYSGYQAWSDAAAMIRTAAGLAREWCTSLPVGLAEDPVVRAYGAALDAVNLWGLTHRRPGYGIDRVTVGGRELEVVEEAADSAPFGTLLHFRKDGAEAQPKMLVVAPMSGHFATLLRGTVRTLLADHDVYLTDWHNARDVPFSAGKFGLSEYVAYVMRYLEHIGPGGHLMAVCQPCVAALAAASLLAEEGSPGRPRSITLMAGPIDARVNPTEVNRLATGRPIEWFERNLIATVPLRHRGALRRVYPGFLQLVAFMSMNPNRHTAALFDFAQHRFNGDPGKADAIRQFYEEYFATADLPAEFYLETVKQVFQDFDLARGVLRVDGRTVRPDALDRCMLVTVEGEKDDICAVGQTVAAQELCTRLKPWMRRHHVQTGAGHYGVFNGRRWDQEIYPMVRETVQLTERNSRLKRLSSG